MNFSSKEWWSVWFCPTVSPIASRRLTLVAPLT